MPRAELGRALRSASLGFTLPTQAPSLTFNFGPGAALSSVLRNAADGTEAVHYTHHPDTHPVSWPILIRQHNFIHFYRHKSKRVRPPACPGSLGPLRTADGAENQIAPYRVQSGLRVAGEARGAPTARQPSACISEHRQPAQPTCTAGHEHQRIGLDGARGCAQ